MRKSRKELGAWGENLAAKRLKADGYEIVERNWRCARGEIDIVVQAGKTLAFVEVKTRRGRKMGAPEAGLTPHKSRKLLQLGAIYVQEHKLTEVNWRIDLVAVELDNDGNLLRFEHIPNAVLGW